MQKNSSITEVMDMDLNASAVKVWGHLNTAKFFSQAFSNK